jgi:hypothetical protein
MILFTEYHFAQSNRPIFWKSASVLMISGDIYLKKFATHIHRGSRHIFQFPEKFSFNSGFAL